MESHTIISFMALLPISLSLLLPSSLGSVTCEDLPLDLCAFSVSSTGQRCLLESFHNISRQYQCKTTDVKVDKFSDWIETDDCVKACSVDRSSVGLSSDEFLQPRFTAKLCSSACYQSCPNIVDLYSNLAAAEGVYLPDLCEAHRSNPQRSMVESSGAAPGPAASGLGEFAVAPSTA